MIDLQKASDTMDHQMLYLRLRHVGVKDVKWVGSYLTRRKQLVNVNET